MNGRQAARAAAKRIEELEWYNKLCARDIKIYNQVILDLIEHRSPCQHCQDYQECLDEGKNVDAGCDQWMLKWWRKGEELDEGKELRPDIDGSDLSGCEEENGASADGDRDPDHDRTECAGENQESGQGSGGDQ